MQNPREEIADVVRLITAALTPELQKAAVSRYYAVDVAFQHPLCRVDSSPTSRNQLLGLLQWYRVMSPEIEIETQQITWDEEKAQLFLEVAQKFHIRWSPLRVAASRLLVRMTLRPSDDDPNLLVISHHEDFYHPDDFMALIVPPLICPLRAALRLATLTSNINARVFGLLGYWTTTPKNQ